MDINDLIDSKPRRRSDLPDWYSALFSAAESEDLSVSELAERAGCSIPSLYNWRRRLAKEAEESHASPGLVHVTVTGSSPRPPASFERLEVRLSSGHSVLVPKGVDPADLAAVLGALAPC